MTEPASPRTEPSKLWSPFGIAWMTLVFSIIPGGILHALNERRLGREHLWRLTLYRNLLAGMLVLLSYLVTQGERPRLFLPVNLFIAMYFYKSQAELFARHVEAGGGRARFLLPVLATLGVAALVMVVSLLLEWLS